MDVAQEAIETGLSSKPPPAVRHHRLPPKLLPVRVSSLGLPPRTTGVLEALWKPPEPTGGLGWLGGPYPGSQGPHRSQGPRKYGASSDFVLWVWVWAIPIKGKISTLYIFGSLGWLEAGLCLPMYVVLPRTGVKADVYLQCLTTLGMQARWEFRV